MMEERTAFYEKLKELILTADETNIETAFTMAKGLEIDLLGWFMDELEIFVDLFPDENFHLMKAEDLTRFLKRTSVIINGFDSPNIRLLEELPKELLIFKNLETLKVENSGIKKIPKWLNEFSQLSSLSFKECAIEEIPFYIKSFRRVKKMHFEKCPISFIPNEIVEMNLTSLKLYYLPIFYLQQKLSELDMYVVNFIPLENHVYFFDFYAKSTIYPYASNGLYRVIDTSPKRYFLNKIAQLSSVYNAL